MSRLKGANDADAGGVGGGGDGGGGGGGGNGGGGGDGGEGGGAGALFTTWTAVVPAHAIKPAAAHAWRTVTTTLRVP